MSGFAERAEAAGSADVLRIDVRFGVSLFRLGVASDLCDVVLDMIVGGRSEDWFAIVDVAEVA